MARTCLRISAGAGVDFTPGSPDQGPRPSWAEPLSVDFLKRARGMIGKHLPKGAVQRLLKASNEHETTPETEPIRAILMFGFKQVCN